MKKIYTTMIAILIVSIGFAQTNVSPARTDSGKNPFDMSSLQKSTKVLYPGEFYYDYPTGLEDLCEGGSYYVVLLQDSLLNTVVSYRAQNYGVGQIFDFSEDYWRAYYTGFLNEDEVFVIYPDITSALSFDISAVEFPFAYLRGTSEPANVVDTLVVSIFATTNLGAYQTINYSGGAYFKNPSIPMLQSIANVDPNISYPIFKQIKHPLTAADSPNETLNANFEYYLFDIDDPNFKNLTPDHKIFVSFSFINGQPFNVLTSVAGTTHGCGGYLMKEDCRLPTFYQGACEAVPNTQDMLNEKSLPMTIMNRCYGDNPTYSNKFINAEIWCGEVARPRVGFYVTNVDLPDAITTNNNAKFSLQPNPASDNCLVKLAQTGNAQIEVFNLVGQQILSENTNNQTITINTSNFTSGVYMVKVTQNGKVSTSKLMVK